MKCKQQFVIVVIKHDHYNLFIFNLYVCIVIVIETKLCKAKSEGLTPKNKEPSKLF